MIPSEETQNMRKMEMNSTGVGSHGLQCQCLTCKWDQYKQDNKEGWNWSFLSKDYSSIVLGGVAGSLLTLLGIVLFKQWRQTAFASLSSKTPTTKTVSSEPMILVNNATDTIYNILTTDPSVGILYIPTSAVYEIDLQLNFVLESLDASLVNISIVKNGLPTDSSAILFSIDQGLNPGLPQVITFHGFRFLKSEDFIQVFIILENNNQDENATIRLTLLNFDFSIKLLKVQKQE